MFRNNLHAKLTIAPILPQLTNPKQVNKAIKSPTTSIQSTINETAMQLKPRPNAKRWWNSDLNKMKKDLNRLKNFSFQYCAITNHHSHRELKCKSNKYRDAILITKQQHWENFLEEMSADKIWMANKYLSNPPGDGRQPRIPSLNYTNASGTLTTIDNNKDKANLLAKTFFPPPQPQPHEQQQEPPTQEIYLEPLPDPPQINSEQILEHISNLPPYKAHAPDGIPNIVLKKCANILISSLTSIYKAIIALDTYYKPWNEFSTIVLRKPGKPNYETPKAYRPIALIPTMAKLLTSIIAKTTQQHSQTTPTPLKKPLWRTPRPLHYRCYTLPFQQDTQGLERKQSSIHTIPRHQRCLLKCCQHPANS